MNKQSPSPSENGFKPRLVIRASAGTGKTFQLSSRYIALLRRTPAERILASTFTRKAAGEILERVLVRLARAAVDDRELQELGRHVAPPTPGRTECLQLLATLTRHLHRVCICTLDSFFARIAGSYALELGLPPGWRILDEAEAAGLRAQAIQQVLHSGVPHETVQLMHLLDKGGTTRSVSRLIAETVDELYEVFLSSPAESWNRFPEGGLLSAERREKLLGILERAELTTKSLVKARDGNCAAARADDWERFLTVGLAPCILSGNLRYNKTPIPDQLHEPYRALARHGLAQLVLAWKHQTIASHKLLCQFHQFYEELKRSVGGLEFGDVTRQLGRANSLTREFRLDCDIEHLLLDEFQDTAPAQWNVLLPIAQRVCTSAEQSFFCVGDAKQAIYGWRGGEAEIFETIDSQLNGLATSPLDVSYRSSQPVIDVVNQVMSGLNRHDNLSEHADVLNEWTSSYSMHSTARRELAGYVCLRTAPAPAGRDDAEMTSADRWSALCRFTAAHVKELVEQSPGATVGILTRRNETVGRLIYELHQLHVEASEEGGNPLADSAAVQLVLSLLTLADHPGHTIARYHVAHSPLGPAMGLIHHRDDAAACALAAHVRKRLIDRGYGAFVEELVDQLRPACDRREIRRLMQLAILAEQFDSLFTTLRPGEFVAYAEQQKRDEPSNAPVRVMNVHQAKGLEFDIVVLPELDQPLWQPPRYVSKRSTPGRPPDLVALYRNEQVFELVGGPLQEARRQTLGRLLRESLCVLYVAMTRAVHALHMILPPRKADKKLPKTYAGLVCAALVPDRPLEPNTILYEQGESRWFEKPPEPSAAHVQSNREPQPLTLTFAPSKSGRHRDRLTPSGQKTARKLSLGEALGADSSSARTRGILIHRWLEQVDWLKADAPLDEQLRGLRRIPPLAGADIDPAWLDLLAALGRPVIRSLFLQKSYEDVIGSQPAELDVRHELPFAQLVDGKMMVGSIDRLVLVVRDGRAVAADVLDFKTDLVPNQEALRERVELYRGQMAAYRDAVARLFELSQDQIAVRLAFLSGGQVERLTFAPADERSQSPAAIENGSR